MNPTFLRFLPPIIDDRCPPTRRPINFSGTGTTEATNTASPLIPGKDYLFTVGGTAIRIAFSRTSGTANAVSSTNSLVLPANTWFIFTCIDRPSESWGSQFVYVEAADGVSAYTASALCIN